MRMMLAGMAVLSLGLVACEEKPVQPTPEMVKAEADMAAAVAAVQAAQIAQNATPDLSPADFGRVCRAAIASVMGRDPAIIKVTATSGNVVDVGYTRDDGTRWKQRCRVLGDRVEWAGVDIDGPGSGPGRWRAEDTIAYRLEAGSGIWIKQSMDGELISEKTFTVR